MTACKNKVSIMVKTMFYLDTRSLSKRGDAPLKIRFTFKKKPVFINLGIRILPEEWDARDGRIVGTQKKQLNNFINIRFTQVNSELLALDMSGELAKMSPGELKRRLEGKEEDTPKPKEEGTFVKKYVSFMESRNTEGTKAAYRATLSRLRAFDPELDSRAFEDINKDYLLRLDAFLAKTQCRNARNVHYRNLRAVFNDAIDDEITAAYPFRKFKLKQEPTRKRSLSVHELRTLRDYPVDEHQRRYRDMFMLTFYLIGINAVDLFNLPKDALHNGRIEYIRAKTHKEYSIKVEPEAQEIIDRYAGTEHLLNILDERDGYRQFSHDMNDALKCIGKYHRVGRGGRKVYEPLFPTLSQYWARHTWASVASELDIPKETIAAGLGHGSNTVTDIYIKYDHRKVDAANRKIIDFLNSDKVL